MEWTNISTSGETLAPAVGKILAFSSPSCFLTSERTVLLAILYFNDSVRGGRLPIARYSMLYFLPVSSAARNILRCIPEAFSIFSFTPTYTFSQNLGTADIHVGCVSRMDCWMRCGSVLTMTVAPSVSASVIHPRSKMCVIGRNVMTRSFSLRATHSSFAFRAA